MLRLLRLSTRVVRDIYRLRVCPITSPGPVYRPTMCFPLRRHVSSNISMLVVDFLEPLPSSVDGEVFFPSVFPPRFQPLSFRKKFVFSSVHFQRRGPLLFLFSQTPTLHHLLHPSLVRPLPPLVVRSLGPKLRYLSRRLQRTVVRDGEFHGISRILSYDYYCWL